MVSQSCKTACLSVCLSVHSSFHLFLRRSLTVLYFTRWPSSLELRCSLSFSLEQSRVQPPCLQFALHVCAHSSSLVLFSLSLQVSAPLHRLLCCWKCDLLCCPGTSTVLLSPECWDYRCVPQHLALLSILVRYCCCLRFF